jgi:transcriptional regulator with PAS, ATPase and Fis domain
MIKKDRSSEFMIHPLIVTPPTIPSETKLAINSLKERRRLVEEEVEYLRNEFWKKDLEKFTKTKSKKMREIFESLKVVTQTKMTVLLTGETGTGKSALAKLVHLHSNRKEKPFVNVHCGAIPDSLIESELFGHEKGAFTGATSRKLGKFEIANGGTIFLDEIGTVTPSLQIKLLQVLQGGVFERLGGSKEVKVDVRVIAATNENLTEMVENKTFRSDLYYRLNVFPIKIPALRERSEDIPRLVKQYLDKYKINYGKKILGLLDSVMRAFQSYSWPGNIRELENVLERAYLIESSQEITNESCPTEIIETEFSTARIALNTSQSLSEVRRETVKNIEHQYFKQLMVENKGDLKTVAKKANVGERQLYNLLEKCKILKEDYKSEVSSGNVY